MDHSARQPLPRGLLGGILGGLGILPMLPIASGVATRFSSPAALPGLERKLGDIKQATYAEAAVLLVAVPLAALFFGFVLPRLLETLARPGGLSFEWAAAGFVLSLVLAQRGVLPERALIAGTLGALFVAAGAVAFRGYFGFRRFFARRNLAAWGALALAGAGFDLARRATPYPARNLIGDLPVELALTGLGLPVIALFVCLSLAKRPAALFQRLGRLAPVMIVLSAAAIFFPRASTVVLGAALVSLVLLPLWPLASSLPRVALPAALLLFLVVCGWKILHVRSQPIQPFEDGHSLAPAQSYLHGARAYVETSPIHGWGADGGVDGFLFRLFGPSLEVFQLRQALWATAALALLALSCSVALGPAWGAVAFLFSFSLGLPFERQMLAFAGLFFLFWSVRTGSARLAIVAGLFTAWEILHSVDYGLFVLFGGAVGLFLLPLLESGLRRWRLAVHSGLRRVAPFFLGVTLGVLPFLLLLAARVSLGSFFRVSFQETPRWVDAAWGLPAGSAWNSLLPARTLEDWLRLLAGETMHSFPLLAILAAAGAVMVLRSASGQFDSCDRAAWIGLAVAAFAMKSVLGRADDPHLLRYGVFVGLPAAWLLLRAARAPRARAAFLAAAAALLFARLHPISSLNTALGWVEGAARRDRAATGEPAPRSGAALLPATQARKLTALKQYLDTRLKPGETFFDFCNQPALYFVTDRKLPIRYHTVAQYESPQKQREVVADLEKTRPPFAILSSGPNCDFDVLNVERAPEVSRYLLTHYELDSVVGDWHLARRKAP